MSATATAFVLVDDPSPLEAWADGSVRFRGSRLLLDTVVIAYSDGSPPAEIAESFGPTAVCGILGALAYYERHREQVDAYLATRTARAEEAWRKIEAMPGHQAVMARLEVLWSERESAAAD